MRIVLPHNNWRPRWYQRAAWEYLERGGRHAEVIWSRRSGKDELALHRAAVAAFERVATYWHMLPSATQARKAIWDAVNPDTGKRRIYEAFPPALIETERNDSMFLRFKNGSTWQVLGSDNYNSMVGSPPYGITYSEWALANPAARAYLRPIIANNGGWEFFITTPRGKNHAYRTFQAAKQKKGAFAQLLTALDTGMWTADELAVERQEYINNFGDDVGAALFEQEYLCSFEAAIVGAVYGSQLRDATQRQRITLVPYNRDLKVQTAWDLGYGDATTIIFFQAYHNEVHVIDCASANLKDIPYYIDLIRSRGYNYERHWLPHDARAKTLAAGGRSIIEQLGAGLGVDKLAIVPNLSIEDGIQAARMVFSTVFFDEHKCADLLDALSQYQYKFDEDKREFTRTPYHDWSSHFADAFRMLAVALKYPAKKETLEPKPLLGVHSMTIDEMWRDKRTVNKRI